MVEKTQVHKIFLRLLGLALLCCGLGIFTQPETAYALLSLTPKLGNEHLQFLVFGGGLVAGLGVFFLVASLGVHWLVLMANFVLWPMVGMAFVRVMAVDLKSPYYGLQMKWAVTEFALALGAAIYLFRRRRFEAHKRELETRYPR